MSRSEHSGARVTATAEEGRHACVAPTRDEDDRPGPPVSDEGGVRRLSGAPMSRRAERPRVCSRGADCVNARDPVRPSEVRSLRERAMKKRPEGQGSQRAASVCRRPGAPNRSGRAERPRVYAVAEPAATPEDRQSERSEVCRDRAREKYKMPEGRACRRAAVVRPAPEAGREPLRGGRARMPSGRRGGAQPGPDGRWHPRGRAGENGAAGGAPSRQGATPRRDPGDCNAGRQPNRSVKRAHCTKRTRKPRTCGLEKKTPREDQQGRCRTWGRGKGRRRPCPSAEGRMQGP